MPHLKLNGYEVPVAGMDLKPAELGRRGRAFSGAALKSVRARKRNWEFETTPLGEADYYKIRDILLGEGQCFPLVDDLYSSKGVAPDSSSADFYTTTGADGDATELVDPNVELSKFSTGAAYFRSASGSGSSPDNLLAANARDAEDGTSGFNAVDGATIAQDSDNSWQGSNSIRVTADTAVNGVKGGTYVSITSTAFDTYSAGFWMKGAAGGGNVTFYFRDEVNGDDSPKQTVTPSSSTWRWYEVSDFRTGSGGTDLRLYIVEGTADAGSDFYIDGLQIEENAFANLWNDNGGVSASGYADYPAGVVQNLDGKSFTMAAWVAFWGTNSSNHYLCQFGESTSSNYFAFIYTGSSIVTEIKGTSDTAFFQSVTVTGWHHVAVTVDVENESWALYFDGSEVTSWSLNSNNIPDFSGATKLTIGSDMDHTDDQGFAGLVNDFILLPYLMTADEISWLYNLGRQFSGLPKVSAEGDFARDSYVEVIGEEGGAEYLGLSDSGTWKSNNRVVEGVIREA